MFTVDVKQQYNNNSKSYHLMLSELMFLLVCSVDVIVLVALICVYDVRASPVTTYMRNGYSLGCR